MNLETLLDIKNKIEMILQSLEYIHETEVILQKQLFYTDKLNDNKQILCDYNENILSEFPVVKKNMEYIMNIIKNNIKEVCDHVIENDYIDIFPERCMPIKYCTKCFSTFK